MSCNWDIIKHILKDVTFYIYCESNSVLIIYCGDIKTRLRYSRISSLKIFQEKYCFCRRVSKSAFAIDTGMRRGHIYYHFISWKCETELISMCTRDIHL